MFINKSQNGGGGFDLLEWLQKMLAAIRGMKVTPKVKLKLARFAQGQAIRNFVVNDPYRIKAAMVRVKIPGLHINPQTIQIRPRFDTAGLMSRSSQPRRRQQIE